MATSAASRRHPHAPFVRPSTDIPRPPCPVRAILAPFAKTGLARTAQPGNRHGSPTPGAGDDADDGDNDWTMDGMEPGRATQRGRRPVLLPLSCSRPPAEPERPGQPLRATLAGPACGRRGDRAAGGLVPVHPGRCARAGRADIAGRAGSMRSDVWSAAWAASCWPSGSTAGPIATAGFGALGVAWIITTSLGWRAAMRRRLVEHRRWMIRSWALTLAAVTLRLYMLARRACRRWTPIAPSRSCAGSQPDRRRALSAATDRPCQRST
jgi:hypothetical protein